jgi:hypothetical protein
LDLNTTKIIQELEKIGNITVPQTTTKVKESGIVHSWGWVNKN